MKKLKYGIMIAVILVGVAVAIFHYTRDPSWRYHALSSACWNGHSDKVKKLLRNGADPNGLTDYNLNPIREFSYPIDGAAWNNHAEIIHLLVQSGADVNVSDSEGGSPLCTAAHQGSLEAVKALLFHGASAMTESGSCCGDVARRSGHEEIAQIIQMSVINTVSPDEK